MNINKSKVSVLVLLAAASVMLARGPGGGALEAKKHGSFGWKWGQKLTNIYIVRGFLLLIVHKSG